MALNRVRVPSLPQPRGREVAETIEALLGLPGHCQGDTWHAMAIGIFEKLSLGLSQQLASGYHWTRLGERMLARGIFALRGNSRYCPSLVFQVFVPLSLGIKLVQIELKLFPLGPDLPWGQCLFPVFPKIRDFVN